MMHLDGIRTMCGGQSETADQVIEGLRAAQSSPDLRYPLPRGDELVALYRAALGWE